MHLPARALRCGALPSDTLLTWRQHGAPVSLPVSSVAWREQVSKPTPGGGRMVDDRDEPDRPLIDPDAMAQFRASKAAESRRNPFGT